MGDCLSVYAESYGRTAYAAISSLDVLLSYHYGNWVRVNKTDVRYYVKIHDRAHYVELKEVRENAWRARVR